jgi:eukaryotic-like serine/threonine-protein kinase
VITVADYELVRPLGEGALGRTFVARPPTRLGAVDAHVVLKVLHRHVTDDELQVAAAELATWSATPSSHLATVHEVGRDDLGTVFVVTEYEPGGSLAAPGRPLGRVDVLRAVAHVAHAAHDLHENGLVHRNIKPANVLLSGRGAKLVDLLVSPALAPGQTASLRPGAALDCVDPRILAGAVPGRTSDVWSLGATMHRALTGVSLYGEIPEIDPLAAVRHLLGTRPRLGGSLEPDEARIILECLAADAGDRPGTAREVAEQIESLVEGHAR